MTAQPRKPLISLITIVKNGAQTLERCLASAAAQTYDEIEHIVLDGASIDGSQAIIARFPHIGYSHSQPDKGPYDATEQGFARAKGQVVGLLHADDWLSADAAQTLADLYLEHPDAEMFTFGMQEHRLLRDGRIIKTRIFRDPPAERFTLSESLYCHGINRFYRHDVVQRHGRFQSERYPQMADRDLLMRMGWEGLKRVTTPDLLYHFLVHPNSNSSGGGPKKIIYLLNETAHIAQDWLNEKAVTAQEKALLIDWYCFNKIRIVWFLLRRIQWREALQATAALLRAYPLRTLKKLLFYKMPRAYRPH